jgi:prepilin-type N-terminal cleavage/methylation domain-containing protein
MTINKSKGFTIIELLVVVAIIAVLAAIVLVNVTGYINQGKNAAIKGNMASMLTNGAVYFDNNGNYGGFNTNAVYTAPAAAAASANGGTALTFGCRYLTGGSGCTSAATDAPTAWCAVSVVKAVSGSTNTLFCVDSTGAKIDYTSGAASAHCSTGSAATDGVCK